MLKAILKNGVIHPLDPLPADWAEGQELRVEAAADETQADNDQWYRELSALCETNDPEDDARLQAALEEIRRHAKTETRKELRFSE
jgi:hypothetical protein